MKKNLIKAFRRYTPFLFALALMSSMLLYPNMSLHAEESFKVTDMNSTATVGSSTLNVRKGPGKNYAAIGKVSPGETVTITGETDNEWYRIDYSGSEGYISSKYVTLGSAEQAATNVNNPNDFINYEEGEPQVDGPFSISPKMILILIVILVVIIVMVSTIIMIKKNDKDDYDDEYDDDLYEDEDDDSYEDEDDDSYEDEEDDSYEDEEDDSYEDEDDTEPYETKRDITEADYTLNIDPRIFKEESPKYVEDPIPNVPSKEEQLNAAMSKLEELQKEIESLKNNN